MTTLEAALLGSVLVAAFVGAVDLVTAWWAKRRVNRDDR